MLKDTGNGYAVVYDGSDPAELQQWLQYAAVRNGASTKLVWVNADSGVIESLQDEGHEGATQLPALAHQGIGELAPFEPGTKPKGRPFVKPYEPEPVDQDTPTEDDKPSKPKGRKRD
jgi:hypothetical protein